LREKNDQEESQQRNYSGGQIRSTMKNIREDLKETGDGRKKDKQKEKEY